MNKNLRALIPKRLSSLPWSHSRCITTTYCLMRKKKKAAQIQSLPSASYDGITIPGEKKDVSLELPKSYSSKFTEAAWYDWWQNEGFFKPSTAKEKFVMLLPPPNVTGKLHIGHAFTGAIQDAIVRWNRMRGLSTLWIPGLDHAGIATQVVVEKQLMREEQLTRHDVGRDAFLRLIWDWKNKRSEDIESQLRRMGLSLDWSRSIFTMDDRMIDAVRHAFCELHEHGLISRKNRVINWCCHLKSTIADIEVDSVCIDGPTPFSVPGYKNDIVLGLLTSFEYPIYDSDKNEGIVVATTRLETMLGDTAIAVHPDDERYKHLIGAQAKHPFCDRLLPIIADESVKPELGTGAVKLTPSHSSIDHDIANRHSLRYISILDDEGHIVNCGEDFDGMKRFDAREKVAQMLQKSSLWRGQEPHAMAVPVCSRSSDIIEPMLKEQWFIDVTPMADQALKASEEGRLKFIPSHHSKVWKHFLSQSREYPWCISRQLWWGHNIPAYRVINLEQHNMAEGWVVGRNLTEAITKARDTVGHSNFKLEQDEDVLDTWFSSALLPFAALGWPNQTPDLHTFYPGNMIESGSDILFFWIARMVMLGEKLTGKLPFNTVLIHSLLLSQGEKMSKSKGNVIDPMSIIYGSTLAELEESLRESNLDRKEMSHAFSEQKRQFSDGIPECGADTLRMALCSYHFKGEPINVEVSSFLEYRSLCNKIWQIFRFYNQYFISEDFKMKPLKELEELSSLDRWILHRCADLIETCEVNFPLANLDVITHKLNHFWRHDISKLYLECSKEIIFRGAEDEKQRTVNVAAEVLSVTFRCLSPFMPYLSEELYQRLPHTGADKAPSVCVAPFPSSHEYAEYMNAELDHHFDQVELISSQINVFKAQFGLSYQTRKVGKAYIMRPSRRVIPTDILSHIQSCSRLEDLYVDTIPDSEDAVYELIIDGVACNILLDLSDCLRSQDEVEVERLNKKLHDLLISQKKLIDLTNHLQTESADPKELEKHLNKIELVKKDVMLAESCVEYFLRIINLQPNLGDDDDKD